MGKLQIEISTPDKNFFEGEADMLIAKASTGEIGILSKHAPLMTILDIGVLRIKEGNEEKNAIINSGFMEVKNDKVSIFTDSAEWPGEVDIERAKKAKERAEARLKAKQDDIDIFRAEMALKRAINRINHIRD